jgi:hypothetical protein
MAPRRIASYPRLPNNENTGKAICLGRGNGWRMPANPEEVDHTAPLGRPLLAERGTEETRSCRPAAFT